MAGIYYSQMVDAARAAGLNVQVPAVCNGWERRARSSGGFPSPPLGVWWHHTASNTSPANDLSYMINGCPDAPVGNWLVDRSGICYPIAAGASNCAGKSEAPKSFSRGVCDVSQGNTRGWQIEVANSGVGGAGGDWSAATVDALFGLSGVLNQLAGNRPDDIISHALGDGSGYTNRKIDPARADCVAGSWRPRSTNANGTWSLPDMRAEANRRATQQEDDIVTADDMEAIAQRTAELVWSRLLPARRGYPEAAASDYLIDTRYDAARIAGVVGLDPV